jgi:CheY-like chemotaxis protein
VFSEVGLGTTFRVLFPTIDPPKKESSGDLAGNSATSRQGKGTVLVVDDEEAIQSVTCSLLHRLGFKTITANDGQQAVDVYRKEGPKIDLVLLDLTMPRMSGDEAFTELRKLDPNVCVVISSGYSEIDIATRFAGKGIGGFLQKPYTFTRLRELLSSLLPADNQ